MSYNVGTAGKIAVFSSANYSMEYATLNLVNEAENILKHVSLIKECSGALVSDTVTFPTGSFSYYLVGTDTSGIAFNSYHMKQQVTFQQPHFDYDSVLSFDAHSAVEMDIDEIFTLNFNFTNHWTYSTYFNFTGKYSSWLCQPCKTTVCSCCGRWFSENRDASAYYSSIHQAGDSTHSERFCFNLLWRCSKVCFKNCCNCKLLFYTHNRIHFTLNTF